jgi:hypothetical protein
MKKHFSWIIFLFVAALSFGILESSGLDTKSRETASLIEIQTASKQKQTQVLDSTKLRHFSKIQSLLDFKRGPSSLPEFN